MTDIRDHLADELHGMLTAPDRERQQGHAKRMLWMLYQSMPEAVQRAFLSRAYSGEVIEFMPTWPNAPKEWNEAARWWGYLNSSAYPLADAELQFWRSIRKCIRIRKPPSQKQAEWMLAMVADYRRWKDTEEMGVVE